MTAMRRMLADESGATLIEYALVAGMIAGVIIAVGALFSGSVVGLYRYIVANIPNF